MYNHITRDGIEIPIVALEDNHLLCIIRMHLRTIESARILLEQKDKPLNTVTAALYKNKARFDPAEIISETHEKLMPYVYEALLRGLTNSFDTQLRIAYGYVEAPKTIDSSVVDF